MWASAYRKNTNNPNRSKQKEAVCHPTNQFIKDRCHAYGLKSMSGLTLQTAQWISNDDHLFAAAGGYRHKLNAIGPTVEVLLSPHMLLLFQEALRVVLWFLLLSLFVFPLENKLHLSPPCTKRCACWQVEQKVSGLSSHPSHLLLFSLLQSFIYLKQILLIPIISWYLNIIFQGQKMPITFSPTWSNRDTHIYISYGIG